MTAHGPIRDRREVLGAAFAEHAERLHRIVSSQWPREHWDLVDDACAIAWQKLAVRPDIEIRPGSGWLGWVFTVAHREQARLVREKDRVFSLDSSDSLESRDALLSKASAVRLPATAFQAAAAREQLRLIEELPDKRRTALLLQATGHSYDEIAELAGLSPTQVNRYVTEARQRVRALDRGRSRPKPQLDQLDDRGVKRCARALEEANDMEIDL